FENSVARSSALPAYGPSPPTAINEVVAGPGVGVGVAVGVGVGVGLADEHGGGVNPAGVKRNACVSPLNGVPQPTIFPPSFMERASTSVVHAASEIWLLRSFISPGSFTPFELSSCQT